MKRIISYVFSVILIMSMICYPGNELFIHQIKADTVNSGVPGDVTGDGLRTVSDVVKLRSVIRSGGTITNGDVNGDGVQDVKDITKLRELIINVNSIDYVTTPEISNGVYQISEISELLWMAENPDKDYKLTSDIDLTQQESWTPIGTDAKPFSGTFDGDGHSITVAINDTREISGIYEQGIFGYVTGDISNLTVAGTINTSIYSGYVGAVAANLAGGTIFNCTNNASIKATSTNNVVHVGGIVGAVRNGEEVVSVIDGAVNNGTITVNAKSVNSNDTYLGNGTTGAVGGIAGFINAKSGVNIGRSINNGKITVYGGKDNIGGIVGQTSVNENSTYSNITYCANKGDITVYSTEGERAAGIIGYVKGGKIEYCYNTANIIEYSDAEGKSPARSGYGNYFGIFGYANLSSSNTLSVIYCYNASPNALEAEICVVRNPSNGTFKNFYMSGRSEYETELNTNATAGTAGTAFSSASDLYSKLSATTEGASAYRSNGSGYPVLYFEQNSYTESVSLGLDGLPAYVDGTVSSNTYNCGPGMASDQNGTTSEDSKMVVVSSTSATSFERYVSKLMNNGFEKDVRSNYEGNIHYTFAKNNKYYHMYYTASKNEARFIEDRSSTTKVKDISTEATGSGQTEFYMYSIDYTKSEWTTSVTDYWQIDCGMMFIIKLADNSLFLIDSGHERQSCDEAMEAQMDFLRKITGTPDTEKVKVRGWFFTHAHGDHVFGGHKLVEMYHDQLDIETVLFNFPAYGVVGGYDGGTFKLKASMNTYFPNAKHVSLHTGQSFAMQGVRFDTLCTHEDWVGSDGSTTLGGDMNTASTVLKITIDGKSLMLLGDITKSDQLEKMYSSTLKSDMVQVAHHGYNKLQSLYKAIAAEYALCPNSEENAGLSSGNSSKFQDIIDAGAKTWVFGGDYTQKFVVSGDTVNISQIDRYTAALGIDFDAPSSDVSEVSGKNAVVETLSSVTSKTNLKDKLITKSVLGSPVTSKNSSSAIRTENAYCAFDGNTGTKWCTETIPAYVKWKMTEPVKMSNYVLYTANDTQDNSGRNPVKWILKGSNDGKNWTTLDAVSDGRLPAANYTGTAFKIKNPGIYQYYSMQFFELGSGSILQLSEIKLYQ